MTEQTNTRARHAVVLDAAKARLDAGDVAGYWKALEEISPDYARLAGSVATGGAHGMGARERLQDAAKDKHGRRYTEQELNGIAKEIAAADHEKRVDNFKESGDAGVSLNDTRKYHEDVFGEYKLDPSTYTLTGISDALGKDAEDLKDTDPTFREKAETAGWKIPDEVATTGAAYGVDTLEAAGRSAVGLKDDDAARARQDIRDKTRDGAEQRKALRDFQNDGSAAGKADADQTNDAPSGNADVTPEASVDSSEVTQMKSALMPSEKDGAREELLYKSADQLTDAEVTELGHWYHDLQPSDPLRGTLDQKRRDFYELTYGNDPAEMDATGRMVMPTSKRGVPETATPAKSKDGTPLADGIKRIVGTLAKAAATLGHGEAVKGLQSGLNLAGQNLKVDGVPGPKTKAGLMKAVAEKGAGKTEETAALGMFQRFAEAERAKGGSASGLNDAVQENVQPLFGDKKPTDAFRAALLDHRPEKLAKRFGEDLGF